MTTLRARIILVALLAIVVAGETINISRLRAPSAATVEGPRDIELFAAVVARVRAGSAYYPAMDAELRRWRYPTASVFNWRTPLVYSTTAALGPAGMRAILVLLGFAALMLTIAVVRRHAALPRILALFVQLGAIVAVLVPAAPLLTEAWAGVLLAISVCAYLLGARRTAAGVGLLGLFVRELAAPYVALCALLAIQKKRWDEVAIWAAGAVAYAVYFGLHLGQVRALQRPGDLAHPYSWLYGGGPAFLLDTLRTNGWVLVSPRWIPAAPALLAILVAACAWPHAAPRLRATVAVYLALFMLVGQPFNYYWGLLTAPLWALATADGTAAVQHWLAISRRHSGEPVREVDSSRAR
jgi:hypothetical protein